MRGRLCLLTILALGLAGFALVGPGVLAPPARAVAETRHAVIVVFRPHANLAAGGGFYVADHRVTGDPELWGYVRPDVMGTVQALEITHGFDADHVYSHAIRGFAARLTSHQIAALRLDPRIRQIEPDAVWRLNAQVLPWGIDRIDGDQSSTRAGNGSGAVSGVNAYVIDTGIDVKHPDLNVVKHVKMISWWSNYDCNGHGTHVSGTIAARDNTREVVGAAPGLPLTGVKVLDCSGTGTTSTVIKGVDWVTANAVRPAVANMSLGGGPSAALDQAIRNSVASGIFYAVAAGNNADDACNYSPSRLGTSTPGLMSVAATDIANQEASFSNFGPCVDIWAPGVNIISTKRISGTATLSGTSMATPHVTGTAALFWAIHRGSTPSDVEAALRAFARPTGTVSKGGTPITLVYEGSF